MSGKELSEKIEKIIPGIKTLFMSGYTDNVIVRRGMLEKGMNFIQKPFNISDLEKKISEVINSE